jgi:PIN domain nuclease of toxin-antitoxin system
LDTCALLWLGQGEPLAPEAVAALAAAQPGELLVSPISAWEVGMLVSLERVMLPLRPLEWFEAALGSGIGLAPLSPQILVEASFLPGGRLRDPADRIIATSARTYGHHIMTRDRALLDFASAGHVHAISC